MKIEIYGIEAQKQFKAFEFDQRLQVAQSSYQLEQVSQWKGDQQAIEAQNPPHLNCNFVFEPSNTTDYLVIYGFGYSEDMSHVPKEHRILNITEEPWYFPPEYLEKFGCILSPYRFEGYSGIQLIGHAIHNWWIKPDWKYDDFIKWDNPVKTKKMSVIVSTNQVLDYHKKRYAFMQLLKQHFSDQIDFYGNGHNPVKDKAEGLFDYKYAVTMENSKRPNYFTEKLQDAYLSWCLPIYEGCTNLENYFPEKSFIRIDLDNFDKSLKIIADILERDPYHNHFEQIKEGRNLVLNKYNFVIATCAAVQKLEKILKNS